MKIVTRLIALVCVAILPVSVWAQEEVTVTKIYSPPVTDLSILPGSGIINIAGHLLPTLTDTYNFGSPNKLWNQGYLAQLNAILFALQTQTIMGGYSTIGFNAGSFAEEVTSGDTTIDFGTLMTPGHFVLTRAHDTGGTITAEYFQVGSLVSGTTYNVTRNLSGLGAKNWAQGVPFLVLGTTGISRLDMLAFDGKPRIQFVEQGATYNAQTVRGVLGNLNGYYDYSTDLNGIGFGAVAGARFMLDPANGIRIYGGDNDAKVTIDAAGNATFDGALTVGTTRNIMRNSECRVGTEDWLVFTDTGLTATINAPGLTPTRLNDESNACYIEVTGTPTAATSSLAYSDGQRMPVTATARYEASTYIGIQRSGNTTLAIQWLDSAGNATLGASTGNACTAAHPGGIDIASWCRSGVIAAAPSGAASARLVVQTTHTAEATPRIYFVRSFFAEATLVQEDLTPWGPAGITEITNGLIKTDAIDARVIVADAISTSELSADSVTSAKILAGTIVASDIASNTITADRLSVSTLDAISANLGTMTAGVINGIAINGGTINGTTITGVNVSGSTVNAGSGNEVVLNNSGMTISNGTGTNNRIKWGSNIFMYGSSSGLLWLDANEIFLAVSGGGTPNVTVSGGTFQAQNGATFYNAVHHIAFQGSGSNRFVCHDNNGLLYSSGTSCSGTEEASTVADLQAQINELRAEIAALKAERRQ